MNTHDIDRLIDKIESSAAMDIAGRSKYIHDLRAAIEADRKRQGDSAKVLAELVALIPLADTLNASASCQDLIDYFKGIVADRKRRGEPVGEVVRDTYGGYSHIKWKTGYKAGVGDKLYLAPQPAEPVKKKPYAQGSALGEFGIIPMCDQVDDEPVKVPSMRDLIADDAYAATFQSVGQYRKALLARYTTTKEQP